MRIEFGIRHEEDKTIEESFNCPSDVTKYLLKVNGNTKQWLITATLVINEMANLISPEHGSLHPPGSVVCAHTGKQWFAEKLERYWSNKYQQGADSQ